MPNSESHHRDPKLDRIVKRLTEQENMAAAWFYGSRARGNHRPDSDYDIAIALNNFDQPYAARRIATELLSVDLSAELEHPVHMVGINPVPTTLAIGILDDGAPLLIQDELRYCREINRIHGLWADHLWHQQQLYKEAGQ